MKSIVNKDWHPPLRAPDVTAEDRGWLEMHPEKPTTPEVPLRQVGPAQTWYAPAGYGSASTVTVSNNPTTITYLDVGKMGQQEALQLVRRYRDEFATTKIDQKEIDRMQVFTRKLVKRMRER